MWTYLLGAALVAWLAWIVATRELVGTHGIYNFTPDSRYGSDKRAVVIVRMDKGQWKLAP